MALTIHERENEGVVILSLDGRLIVGYDASGLRKRVMRFIDQAQTNIILDLKDVTFIDSTGLGTMVMCHATLEKAGGALKLLHLSKRNVELLVLTKLSTVFEMFDEETDAVNSFFPDREVRRFDILEFVKGKKTRDEGTT